MKKTILSKLFLYLMVIAISFSACSKDEGSGPDASGNYYFKASLYVRKVNFHTVNFQGGGNDLLTFHMKLS